MTEYKNGNRVEHRTWGLGTVEVGPYNGNLYVVLFDDHVLRKVSPGTFKAAVPTDPRRDVLGTTLARQRGMYWDHRSDHAELAPVVDELLAALDAHTADSDPDEPALLCFRSDCPGTDHPVTRETGVGWCNGVAADAPARYRDRDRDVWEEIPDTTSVKCVESHSGFAAIGEAMSKVDLADEYGPLTRI